MLDKAGGFEVVAEREDGSFAANTYQEILPDAVIMDIQMPQMNGFEAAGTILGEDPPGCSRSNFNEARRRIRAIGPRGRSRGVLPEEAPEHRGCTRSY